MDLGEITARLAASCHSLASITPSTLHKYREVPQHPQADTVLLQFPGHTKQGNFTMAGEGLGLAARALPFPVEGARGDGGMGRHSSALEINEHLSLLHEDFWPHLVLADPNWHTDWEGLWTVAMFTPDHGESGPLRVPDTEKNLRPLL